MCTVWLSDPLETYKNLEQLLIEDHFKDASIDIVKIDAHAIEEKAEADIFPDILILDTLQPFVEGKKLIKLIREKNPDTRIIVVSGNSTDLSEFINLNIPFILKPFVASTFIGIFNTIYTSYTIGGQ
jgi:DNA-binding response OmpR family regulator